MQREDGCGDRMVLRRSRRYSPLSGGERVSRTTPLGPMRRVENATSRPLEGQPSAPQAAVGLLVPLRHGSLESVNFVIGQQLEVRLPLPLGQLPVVLQAESD